MELQYSHVFQRLFDSATAMPEIFSKQLKSTKESKTSENSLKRKKSKANKKLKLPLNPQTKTQLATRTARIAGKMKTLLLKNRTFSLK